MEYNRITKNLDYKNTTQIGREYLKIGQENIWINWFLDPWNVDDNIVLRNFRILNVASKQSIHFSTSFSVEAAPPPHFLILSPTMETCI